MEEIIIYVACGVIGIALIIVGIITNEYNVCNPYGLYGEYKIVNKKSFSRIRKYIWFFRGIFSFVFGIALQMNAIPDKYIEIIYLLPFFTVSCALQYIGIKKYCASI